MSKNSIRKKIFQKSVENCFKSKNKNSINDIFNKLFVHIQQKFRKNNKCFKYNEKKHLFINFNALC